MRAEGASDAQGAPGDEQRGLDAEAGKRIPYLSIAFLLGAFICQTLVLAGNLHTVHSLHRIGASSSGWVATGMSLAESVDDFSTTLFGVSKTMAHVLSDVLAIEGALESVLLKVSGTMESASSEQMAVGTVKGASPDMDSFIQVRLSVTNGDPLGLDAHGAAPDGLNVTYGPLARAAAADAQSPCGNVLRAAEPELRAIRPQMRDMTQRLVPVLRQMRNWQDELSDKVQSYVGQFGVTMGRVQEIFDTIVDGFGSTRTSDEEMIEQTYSLFDVSNTGRVSLDDLGNVSDIYGIAFLEGERAAVMFDRYDGNGDGLLDKGEFGRMMLDPSTPAMMATVLRAYADKLAQVAGPLKRAETRAEVARAVASYLQVVVSKNMTKVSWMAEALTNGSMPLNFTAAVLTQLAMAAEDPSKLTTAETGLVLVRRMVDVSPETVRRALEFLVSPDDWASEGLDPVLQASVVQRVARWTAAAGMSSGAAVCAVLVGPAHSEAPAGSSYSDELQQLEREMQVLPQLYQWRAQRGYRARLAAARAANAKTADQLLGSGTSRRLFAELLGTALPASAQTSPEAARAVQKGYPASPEVLQFAQWLASNASRNAAMMTSKCLDYSARVSQHVQGLLGKMEGLPQHVHSVLRLMNGLASREAIGDIMATVDGFRANATEELVAICDRLVNATPSIEVPANSTWAKVSRILRDIEAILPGVIELLEVAQMRTAGFSSSLSSTFEAMEDKLPLGFHLGARVWMMIWVGYYVFFLVVDAVMLVWILWVSGVMAKVAKEREEEYQPPQTLGERLQVCWAGCNACLRARCVDGKLCFWSLLIFIELFVFVAFLVSLLLSVLALVKVFIHAGCNQLYMLGDGVVCTEVMANVKFWLTTFLNRDFLTPMTVCDERQLMTCNLISKDLLKSSALTVVGGFLGSFFTFQVILESAVLHERARWVLALKDAQRVL